MSDSPATLTVTDIAPQLVRNGTKIRVGVNIAADPDGGGDGGKVTVWIDPSGDLEDIKVRAIAAAKALFARASLA